MNATSQIFAIGASDIYMVLLTLHVMSMKCTFRNCLDNVPKRRLVYIELCILIFYRRPVRSTKHIQTMELARLTFVQELYPLRLRKHLTAFKERGPSEPYKG